MLQMEMFQALEKGTFYLTEVMLLPGMVLNVGAEGIIFSLVHGLSDVFWNTREKPQLACSPNGVKILQVLGSRVFSHMSGLKQLPDLESGQNFLQAGKSWVLFVCFSLSAFILAQFFYAFSPKRFLTGGESAK